jgi:hypothetical protein
MTTASQKSKERTIEIKVLGPQDAGVLEHVDPDVFDDPIDVCRAVEFLADPRHHLVVAVDDGVVSVSCRRFTTFIRTSRARNSGSTRSAWPKRTGARGWGRA